MHHARIHWLHYIVKKHPPYSISRKRCVLDQKWPENRSRSGIGQSVMNSYEFQYGKLTFKGQPHYWWVATSPFLRTWQAFCRQNIQASAVDKSPASANDLRRTRLTVQLSGGLPSKLGPGMDVPLKFAVDNDYACLWKLMRSINTKLIMMINNFWKGSHTMQVDIW